MNRRENWGLDFKAVRFNRFVDAGSVTCDEQACCDEVRAQNPNSPLDAADLSRAIEVVRGKKAELHNIVCGHDLAAIISLTSRVKFRLVMTPEDVERQLSRSFALRHFVQTSTFEEFVQWEQRNVPFLINI